MVTQRVALGPVWPQRGAQFRSAIGRASGVFTEPAGGVAAGAALSFEFELKTAIGGARGANARVVGQGRDIYETLPAVGGAIPRPAIPQPQGGGARALAILPDDAECFGRRLPP